MKVFKVIAGMIVVAASVVAINTVSASATSNTAKCDIAKLKLGEQTGKNMVETNSKITATFTVTGTNCTTPVTLAVWKSPVDSVDKIGENVSNQTLFTSTTQTFGPGTHSLTADLPGCFYQADLLVGDKATAPDGTPNYAYQNGQILADHPLRDFKFGGNKKCEVTPPEDPEDPETPEEPTGGQGGDVQGATTTLPETGAGAVAGTFVGVSTLAGALHAVVRRFRK